MGELFPLLQRDLFGIPIITGNAFPSYTDDRSKGLLRKPIIAEIYFLWYF